jgi:predicted membrane chloride channel (bestrophin family)
MSYTNLDTRTLEAAYSEAEELLAIATKQVQRAQALQSRMERNTQAAFIALESRRADVSAFVASCNRLSERGSDRELNAGNANQGAD